MRDKALAVLLVGGPGLAFLCAAGSSIRWFASTTVERLADWIEVIVGEAENLLATAFSHFLHAGSLAMLFCLLNLLLTPFCLHFGSIWIPRWSP